MMHNSLITTGQNSSKQAGTNQQLFFRPRITVNQPNDKYEHEAAAVAGKVMRKGNTESGTPLFFNAVHHTLGKPMPQHVQQKGTGKSVQRSLANIGTAISATNQQAIRNRISFWDVPLAPSVVSTGALEDYFRKSPPNASLGFSGTTSIDSSVIQTTAAPQNATFDVARGLSSLPGHFVSTHNMPQNSTATINMDLSSFGGQAGIFRITYLNANPGTTGAAQLQFHLEFVSAARTTPTLTTRPGAFAVGGHNFSAIGWPDNRYDELIDVMNRVPATALQQIDGMRFRYRSQLLQTISQLGEDGEALLQTGVPANQREIIIWSTVTRPTVLNYSGFARTAYVVAHEIGHWLDFNPIFIAANGTATDSASGFYRIGGDGALTEGANRRTRFSRLNSANPSATSYGTTDLKESFAEYFAMYVTDPAQLRLLRPDIFSYFQSAYP
ncbi:hypothetical protein ACTJIJ_05720 [Niabella sp. 22666]|uniref:hypothetical protein n=1 Tax=Niabella sp. 22666 TaxID=3453954 RepID=UPI003F843D98